MRYEIALISLCVGVLTSGCAERIRLFNGYNLDGWKFYTDDPGVVVTEVWSIRDGILRCEGRPNGYLRTTRPFSNYKLTLEWRWPQEPTNSGVLLHGTGEDRLWPTCYEAQLRSGDAGDLIIIGEELSLTADGKAFRPEESRYLRLARQKPSSEKKPPQWNRYEIICRDNTLELIVNGVRQNRAEGLSAASGFIALQSEGSPIEFRNIVLEKLR
ncbi:MAG TPA: DUF1080 domain-containing protein [Anaerohalosphaeraceae bacterium]|nr:DUF1080 domain-containing protein [Anaerohalosphaeraceae bacterium]